MSTQYEKMQAYVMNYEDVLEMQKILQTESVEFDNLNNSKEEVNYQIFIDTATNYGLTRWENKILKIISNPSATLDERRGKIKSYLIGQNKLNSSRIQELAKAYNYGAIDVVFNSPNIKITFKDVYDTPTGYDDFYNYITYRKPAHLGLVVIFKYVKHYELGNYIHQYLENYTHEQLRSGKFLRGD